MIVEYICQNFKSIGEFITFSMVSSKDKSLPNEVVNVKNVNLLKKAIIYGANGSGKSNFIKSIELFKFLVSNSLNFQLNTELPYFPHKLKMNEPTVFKIQMFINGIRFIYAFLYNLTSIKEEYLYYVPKDRPAKIYHRVNDAITYGENFRKDLMGVEKDYLKPNKLMLSCAANYRNIPLIQTVFLYITNGIIIYNDQNWRRIYSAEEAIRNSKAKETFINFLNEISKKKLKGIESKIENIKVNEDDLPPIFNDNIVNLITSKKAKSAKINFEYNGYFLNLEEESEGIQKLFSFFFPFIDMVLNDKVFLCDEFEAHLHPLIVRELIKLFDNNSKQAQMIFTTHDVNLLDLDVFRRDEIYFTDIKENDYTDLYSLIELKSIRKDESIKKNYLLGKYSGIPIINKDITQHLYERLSKDE